MEETTLNQFLKDCHVYLSLALRVRPRTGKLAKTSTITAPDGRYYPRRLKRWTDFDDSTRDLFDQISTIYHPPAGPTPNPFVASVVTKSNSRNVQKRELTSEDDLRAHERTNMEDMVTTIIDDIVNREGLAKTFGLDKGIAFDNHTNNLSSTADEVVQVKYNLGSSDPMPKPKDADQIGVVMRDDGANTVSFLIEYKSPWKLPKQVVRKGVRHDMDLERDVINRAKYSTDEEENFRELSEKAVAAVTTQLYSYMLENGTEYGYISTGEVYLFLQICHDEPEVAYYHLAEPNSDVDMEAAEDGALMYTAISQALCFCLRASNSSPRDQHWRREAKAKVEKWQVNIDQVLLQMTPLKIKAEAPSSEYKPPRARNSRPDVSSGDKMTLRPRKTCKDDPAQAQRDPESSSDERDPTAESPSARAKSTGSKAMKINTQTQAARDNAGTGQHKQQRQQHQHLPYCTHKCLRGILQGDRLDPQCPNRALHPSTLGLRHTIDAPTLRILLRNQLDSDMDNNCTPLNIQGARGALFKLTLASHGYTLVGKGTVRAFVPDLNHEGRIYRQLRRLQGTCVPVCIGNIDCIYPYEYDLGVQIVHFLLLSWGGVALTWREYSAREEELKGMEDKLRALGVEHEDERCLNVLRDEQSGELMLIDFERATVSQPETLAPTGKEQRRVKMKMPLGEVSSNVPKKRPWEVDATGDVIGLKIGGQAPEIDLYHSLSI